MQTASFFSHDLRQVASWFLRRSGLVSVAFAMLVLAPQPGCGEADDKTTGTRVTHALNVALEGEKAFDTSLGWSVQVDAFAVSIGGVSLFTGAPSSIYAQRSGGNSVGSSWFKSVWAHPGHYEPGTTLAEMLTPSSVDVLVGGKVGEALGVSGSYRSGTVYFGTGATTGPLARALGNNKMRISGVAKRGAEAKAFAFEATEADLTDATKRAEIVGCLFKEEAVEKSGTVTLTISAKRVLDQVEFEKLSEPLRESAGFRGFLFGARGGSAYRFAFKP
jgi:hypothetical protein